MQSQAVSMMSHRSEIGTTGIAKAGVSDTPGKLFATMAEKLDEAAHGLGQPHNMSPKKLCEQTRSGPCLMGLLT